MLEAKTELFEAKLVFRTGRVARSTHACFADLDAVAEDFVVARGIGTVHALRFEWDAPVDRVEAHFVFGAGVRAGLAQPFFVAARFAVTVLAAFAVLMGLALDIDTLIELLDADLVSAALVVGRLALLVAEQSGAVLAAIAPEPVVAVIGALAINGEAVR